MRKKKITDDWIESSTNCSIVNFIIVVTSYKWFKRFGSSILINLSIQMGVFGIRMLSSTASILPNPSFNSDMFHTLVRILPLQNLLVVDLSHYIFYGAGPTCFWENYSSLEQITDNTTHNESSALEISGTALKYCSRLTEINMDNSMFEFGERKIFQNVSFLEVQQQSLTDSWWTSTSSSGNNTYSAKCTDQICSEWSPVVTVFRSNLTPANMDMLWLVRPDIVFS